MGNCMCRRKTNVADTGAGIFEIQIDRVHESPKSFHKLPEPSTLPSEKFEKLPEPSTLPAEKFVKLPEPSSPDPPHQWKKASTAVSSVASEPVIHKDVEDLRQMAGYGHVDIFTYNEMRRATNNFRPDLILGEGGFGLVYKGVIDNSVRQGFDTTVVAVKELNPDGYQGDKEWLAEINYLGQLTHQNLVKLIGYCCEDEHRLLVYEYMACGSLEKHLFRRTTRMPWLTRLKVALDAARGLAFLHGAKTPIIYRDFKTSNILLDADFNGKLSDFGLAKEGPIGEQTHVSTRVMGTYGYAAPEYIMTGHLTAKSDVYGYGVVLLEMLIGRRANDNGMSDHENNLVDWVRPLLVRFNKLLKIIDPRMDGQYSDVGAEKVAKLAYDCLSQNPKSRPTMSEVVDILDGVLEAEKNVAQERPLRDRVADRSHAGRTSGENEDAMRHDRRTTTTPPRGRSASQDTVSHNPNRTPARKEFNAYPSR